MGLGVFCSSTCMDVFYNTVLPWHQPWIPPAVLGNPCSMLGASHTRWGLLLSLGLQEWWYQQAMQVIS